jgi:hypothetical protein
MEVLVDLYLLQHLVRLISIFRIMNLNIKVMESDRELTMIFYFSQPAKPK